MGLRKWKIMNLLKLKMEISLCDCEEGTILGLRVVDEFRSGEKPFRHGEKPFEL